MNMQDMKKLHGIMAEGTAICEKAMADETKRIPGGDTPVDIGAITQAVTQAMKETFAEVR